MADLISSTSYVRQRIEELREGKRLARQVEVALAEKKAEDAAEKKRKSDARIAAKLARIAGEEPPVIEEPAVEAVVAEEVQEELVIEDGKPSRVAVTRRVDVREERRAARRAVARPQLCAVNAVISTKEEQVVEDYEATFNAAERIG